MSVQPPPKNPRLIGLDVRFALRTLGRSPLGTGVMIAALAVVIGTAVAFFGLWWGARYRAHDVAAPERLFLAMIPSRSFSALRTLPRGVAALGVAMGGPGENKKTGEKFSIASVSPGWLETVRPRLVKGAFFEAQHYKRDAPGAVIISHRLWQSMFAGRADVVGQVFSENGPIIVAGVMSPGFSFPAHADRATDVWFPAVQATMRALDHQPFNLLLAVRLAPGVSPNDAGRELARAIAAEGQPVELTPIGDESFADEHGVLHGTLLAALALLLAGCAGLGTQLLGQTLRRQREQVLCLAVGAWPARLVRQTLLACLFATIGAGLLGLGVAHAALTVTKRFYLTAAANPGFRSAGLDGPALLFAVLLMAAVTLLIALPSGVHMARGDIHGALKSSARTHSGGRGARHLREVLLALEVALASLLLLSAGSAAATFGRRLADKGFDARDVVFLRVDFRDDEPTDEQPRFRSEVLARLSALPGVEAAALLWPEPFPPDGQGAPIAPVWLEDAGARPAPGKAPLDDTAVSRTVGGDSLRTLRIPLLRGRMFAADHDPATKELVVDRLFVQRVLGGGEALGRRVRLDKAADAPLHTIVGVVEAVKSLPAVGELPWGTMYLPHRGRPRDEGVTFLVRSGRDVAGLAADMRRIAREVDPRHRPLTHGLYRELLVESQRGFLGQVALTSAFGLLALLLAMLGLHAAAMNLVLARTNELGVRLAIGASPGSVVRLILREGVRPIVAGLLLAAGGAAVALRSAALRDFLLAGESVAWAWATAAGLLVCLASFVALLAPAWRASRLAPMAALRYE